MTQTGFD